VGKHSFSVCVIAVATASSAGALAQTPEAHQVNRHVANPTGILSNVCHLGTVRRNIKSVWIGRPTFNGSGVLYRQRYVLTAAHNVHGNLFSSLRRLRVTCGIGQVVQDGTRIDHLYSRVRTLRGYSFLQTLPGRFRNDIAVVQLPRPICTAGAVSLVPYERSLRGSVSVAGFPGEGGDNGGMNRTRLYRHDGTLLAPAQDYLVSYNAGTERGVSGGPVWIEGPRGPEVIGIHVGPEAGRSFDADTLRQIHDIVNTMEAADPASCGS